MWTVHHPRHLYPEIKVHLNMTGGGGEKLCCWENGAIMTWAKTTDFSQLWWFSALTFMCAVDGGTVTAGKIFLRLSPPHSWENNKQFFLDFGWLVGCTTKTSTKLWSHAPRGFYYTSCMLTRKSSTMLMQKNNCYAVNCIYCNFTYYNINRVVLIWTTKYIAISAKDAMAINV